MAYKLWGMSIQRSGRAVTIAVLMLAACRGERKPTHFDTAGVRRADSVAAIVSEDTTSTWDAAVGPLLAVTTDSGSNTVSVVGGTDSIPGVRSPLMLDLFGRSGLVGTSILAPGASDAHGDCAAWPVSHISAIKSKWSVGLESGRALPIFLDSLEAMRSTDSSQFVTNVIRLAADLKVTHDSIFSSVPFVVQRAYRFRTENIEGIVALVQRNIPTEANPRSDYTTFIAERPIGANEPYHIAYQKRTAGGDDQTVVVSVLAAVTLVRTHQPILIVRYEMAEGEMVGFIERIHPGAWRATWTSDYSGC